MKKLILSGLIICFSVVTASSQGFLGIKMMNQEAQEYRKEYEHKQAVQAAVELESSLAKQRYLVENVDRTNEEEVMQISALTQDNISLFTKIYPQYAKSLRKIRESHKNLIHKSLEEISPELVPAFQELNKHIGSQLIVLETKQHRQAYEYFTALDETQFQLLEQVNELAKKDFNLASKLVSMLDHPYWISVLKTSKKPGEMQFGSHLYIYPSDTER